MSKNMVFEPFLIMIENDQIGYFFDICCNSMAKCLVGVIDEW